MARRVIWLAFPIFLIAIFLQGRNFQLSSSQMPGGSGGATDLGILILMVAILAPLLYALFKSTRLDRTIIPVDPTSEVVFWGSAFDVLPMAITFIGGMIA